MPLKLKVPDINCNSCAKAITTSIQVIEPDAKIDIDVENKIVSVESKTSSEFIKQAINAAGFQIANSQTIPSNNLK